MEPGAEGEWLGADGWTARGVYSDGLRRLTRRPGAAKVEIFYFGELGILRTKGKAVERALRQAKRQRRGGTYSLTHLLTSDI